MSYPEQPIHDPHTGRTAGPARKGSNGLATAGFVLGLLGLLGSWIPVLNIVGIILGVIGVVLAAVGLAKSKKVNAGKGLAIAGLVCGALAVIFAVLINACSSARSRGRRRDDENRVEAPSRAARPRPRTRRPGRRAGTTRENPAPLGSAITGDDWTVKIKRSRR